MLFFTDCKWEDDKFHTARAGVDVSWSRASLRVLSTTSFPPDWRSRTLSGELARKQWIALFIPLSLWLLRWQVGSHLQSLTLGNDGCFQSWTGCHGTQSHVTFGSLSPTAPLWAKWQLISWWTPGDLVIIHSPATHLKTLHMEDRVSHRQYLSHRQIVSHRHMVSHRQYLIDR